MDSIGLTPSCNTQNYLVSAGSVSYTYDHMGRRLSRTLSGITTTYVWDGAHIIAEYVGSSLTKKYIYGPGMDSPVVMINVSGGNEDWYYYYADALGSIRLLTDTGGSIVESYTYLTYGTPYVMTGAGTDGNWLTNDLATTDVSSYGNPYLFTSRRWDSDTDIYYYRFRDYSPMQGRFLQADPAGYIDTMNLYAYCGNNPVNWIDPWGLVISTGDEDGDGEWGIGPGLPGHQPGMPGAPDYEEWIDSLPPRPLLPKLELELPWDLITYHSIKAIILVLFEDDEDEVLEGVDFIWDLYERNKDIKHKEQLHEEIDALKDQIEELEEQQNPEAVTKSES